MRWLWRMIFGHPCPLGCGKLVDDSTLIGHVHTEHHQGLARRATDL